MRILYGVVGEGMGHAMRSRVVIDHLGLELLGELEVGAHVARPAARHRAPEVAEDGVEVPDLVVLVDEGEAPDLVHA